MTRSRFIVSKSTKISGGGLVFEAVSVNFAEQVYILESDYLYFSSRGSGRYLVNHPEETLCQLREVEVGSAAYKRYKKKHKIEDWKQSYYQD